MNKNGIIAVGIFWVIIGFLIFFPVGLLWLSIVCAFLVVSCVVYVVASDIL